ncbi:MAG: aldo/keto reductase [Bifidobacteriaceae bacterium]|jgi:2,5-diketo-D-gluconate reductase A|nr:aldo/keto reductase [Bifidobacteriaceae bacterium]
MTVAIPTLKLNQGPTIPQIGLGTYHGEVPDLAKSQAIVESAIAAGYRHIDTAAGYGTEPAVGAAVRASGLPREQFYITTKINNRDHVRDFRAAHDKSLADLGLDYIDLYLIHWPQPKTDRYVDVWRAFIQFQQEGTAKAIGVSNFWVEHLERLINETGVVPAINQIEYHPYWQQKALRQWGEAHGIITEAWSPLGSGHRPLSALAPLVAIADKYGKSVHQVTLRWQLQLGIVTIPRADQTPHQIANLQIFDFELTPEEIEAINGLHDPAYPAMSPLDIDL